MSVRNSPSFRWIAYMVLFSFLPGCERVENDLTTAGTEKRVTEKSAAEPVGPKRYLIALQSGGEEVATVELSIGDDFAISKVAGVTERFDLVNLRWQNNATNQWVTLAQCESWAEQSRQKSQSSTASASPEQRSFVVWSLNPSFEVATENDVVSMTSGQVDYKITVESQVEDSTNYYRYAKLNAYKKAMTERQLPPFAELKVLEELERRRLIPKKMEIDSPGIPGSPSFAIHISSVVEAPN